MTDLSELQLDNPFWQFSLALWRNKALQEHLLALQNNQDYRVNLLLLAIWLSFEDKDLRPHLNEFIAKTEHWHETVVAPIRLVRQTLPKNLPSQNLTLKSQLQNCELQAEQIEQALLYHASLDLPATRQTTYDSLDWLIVNLSASELSESDLLLLLQNCLPTYPTLRITERMQAHR